jgi:hypothetical protein
MSDTSEPLHAQKPTSGFLIPAEFVNDIIGHVLDTTISGKPTDADREEMRQRHEAEKLDRHNDYQRTRALCAGQPAAIAVLDIHQPDDCGYCTGCPYDEYEEPWECATYTAIKKAVTDD